jgi:outer membrane protein assembly factor BamD (BamD/ComL family)
MMIGIKSFPGLRSLAVALVMAITLGACSSEKPDYVERPVEDLYNEAMDAMLEKDFAVATAKFDEVERQHPYSLWANKAQLMAAVSPARLRRSSTDKMPIASSSASAAKVPTLCSRIS